MMTLFLILLALVLVAALAVVGHVMIEGGLWGLLMWGGIFDTLCEALGHVVEALLGDH